MRPEQGLFAVADGMGGHVDGALASAILAERLNAMAEGGAAVDAAALRHCLAQVNDEIWRHAARRRQVTGSTVAALLVRADRFLGLWAGDSRLYHLHDGVLTQVSRDHSEVQELVDHGVLSPAEARNWPRRNVITRALGVREGIDLASVEGRVAGGDSFVLCSDGLTTRVDPDEIRGVIEARAPQPACAALVELAVQRGETDDVTVVVVHVQPGEAGGPWEDRVR